MAANLIPFPTGAGCRIGKSYAAPHLLDALKKNIMGTRASGLDSAANRANANDYFTNAPARMGWGTPSLAEGTEYELVRLSYNYWLMVTLYRNHWISRRIVDTPAQDMVRAWPKLTSDVKPEDLTSINRAIRRTNTKSKMLMALKWARLFGGAGALIVIEGQENVLDEPLDLDAVQIGGYRGLIPFDRWTGIYPSTEISTDITKPLEFGLPQFYEVGAPNGTQRFRIHASRILRFCGPSVPTPEYEAQMYWGISVIEPAYESLRKLDNLSWNMLSTSFRSNLIGMKIPDLAQMLSGLGGSAAGVAAFGGRMQQFNELLSNQSLVLLPKDGDLTSVTQNMAGWDGVLQQFQMDVAGASQIPMTRLFGRTATGLGQANDADERIYEELIALEQDDQVRPQLDKLYPVICMSVLGEVPDDLDLVFPSVRVLTEEEKSNLAKSTGDAIIATFGAGLINKPQAMKELKQTSDLTGLFTNITDEDIAEAEKQEAIQPALPPGAEQEGNEEGGANPTTAAKAASRAVNKAEGGKGGKDSASIYDVLLNERLFGGFQCVIEYPAGGFRILYNNEGDVVYNRELEYDYGYLRGTMGRDGDEIDCILGPDQHAPNVYVIDMIDMGPDVDQREDEDKVFLGFRNAEQAKRAFIKMYAPDFFGGIEEIPAKQYKEIALAAGRANDAKWEESKHPRGNAKNAGQFSKGSGVTWTDNLDEHTAEEDEE